MLLAYFGKVGSLFLERPLKLLPSLLRGFPAKTQFDESFWPHLGLLFKLWISSATLLGLIRRALDEDNS